jgi:RHH-type transcriptional regulator, rel operon repressor / antitoxin RelB
MNQITIEANPMGDTTTLTIRVDQEMKDRLERIAKSQRRSKAFVAVNAIEDYLAVQEAQIRGIEEAIASADRGELISHERVREWAESLGTDKPLPKPTV